LVQQPPVRSEVTGSSRNRSMLPHHLPNFVRCNLCGSSVQQLRNLPPALSRHSREPWRIHHVACSTLRENQTFQKRIGRQPVRSMNPGSRNLAYCIQPRQTGPACKVCHYSTHHIVRRWSYRDQLPARIDASSHTECEYPRKALLEPFTQQPGIQEHLVSCALLPIHLTSHYVARRKLGQLVALGHEALTPIVDEHRTLTANSLGYQRQRILRRVQGRWVELYELHVAELHPGPVGHGEPVARGHLGIRGVAVHLAASTRGEHGGVCKDLCGYAGNARPHTSTAVAVHYEIQYPRLLHHFHLIGFLHA